MKDSKDILHQVEQKIAASPNNSPTAAGRPDQASQANEQHAERDQLIDAINHAFELLRINYHHLYFSAYNEMDALNAAKRLWLESLAHLPPAIIIKATTDVIKQSDYLPTISKILTRCQQLSGSALPDTHSAYIEACHATSPKQNYAWSHPAVYHAGKACEWFFLNSNSEKIAFPVFAKHYEALRTKILNGEELPAIKPLALPEQTETPLNKLENAKKLQALRDKFDL